MAVSTFVGVPAAAAAAVAVLRSVAVPRRVAGGVAASGGVVPLAEVRVGADLLGDDLAVFERVDHEPRALAEVTRDDFARVGSHGDLRLGPLGALGDGDGAAVDAERAALDQRARHLAAYAHNS